VLLIKCYIVEKGFVVREFLSEIFPTFLDAETMKNQDHDISSWRQGTLGPSRRYIVTAVALMLLQSSIEIIHGFVIPTHVQKSAGSHTRTSLWDTIDTEEDSLTSSSSVIWNWNAANSSLGSLLLKLQKEEEEEMKRAVGQTTNTTASKPPDLRASPPPTPQSELAPMDLETARELDDAVTKGSKENLLDGIKVLPTSSLYSTLTKKKKLASKAPSASRTRLFRRIKKEVEFDVEILNMPLSMPEHYDERIGRDMRHLAVSISSNVNEVWQWRLFCQEKGGIVPLLKCVQEGAKFIRQHINDDRDSEFAEFAADQHEETFMAACTACRALRDLCAISPELSAVITDSILRANDLWGDQGPMSDFVTLLHHANEVEIKREARDILRLNRRNRRGTYHLLRGMLLSARDQFAHNPIHS